MTENSLAGFEDYKIRRVYDEESEKWYFSVVVKKMWKELGNLTKNF